MKKEKKIKTLEKIELPKRKLTKKEINTMYNNGKSIFEEKENKSLREQLADLEHEQWAHWTKYFLENLNEDNRLRWGKQAITPYYQLSEKEKDSDREWADKVLKIFKEKIQNVQRKIEIAIDKWFTSECSNMCDPTGHLKNSDLEDINNLKQKFKKVFLLEFGRKLL